jgi:hypothetical protein
MTNRCTNSNRGTFNHECGKPAEWLGVHNSGWPQAFCSRCREHGDEARGIYDWTPYTPERMKALRAEYDKQSAMAVYCDY